MEICIIGKTYGDYSDAVSNFEIIFDRIFSEYTADNYRVHLYDERGILEPIIKKQVKARNWVFELGNNSLPIPFDIIITNEVNFDYLQIVNYNKSMNCITYIY